MRRAYFTLKRWSSSGGRRAYFTPKRWSSSGGRRAYIALVSLLILSAIVLLVGATLALLAVSQAQQSLAEEKGSAAHALAEGCVADALLFAFYNDGYTGGTRSLPEGNCTINVSKMGDNWVLTSAGRVDGRYMKRIRVNILRTDSIQVLSWKEIE